jgi:hypothetical protein
MRNDTDGQKDETFYYIVDDSWQVFIKAIDMNCNEVGLPVAFSILDRFAEPPACAQP